MSPDSTIATTPAGWDRVAGQPDAVALLQHIAERPSHAYLLVGPRGSGVEEAARCFAAAVVAPDDPRSFDLALRGVHPDVIEIDPAANQIRVDDAQHILDEAYRSPIEGERKVILVFEAERLNEQAGNKLLKTLEEPPNSAMIVLVTSGADQLLSTIRSRCQRVDFAHLSTESIATALQHFGYDERSAALYAGLSGGRLDRARAFGARLAGVRAAFLDVATTCDGSGAHVARSVASVQDAMQDAVADVESAQAAELAHLSAELESSGYPDRVVRTQLRRLEEQHKRAHRRARTEVLIEGITVLETVYRDALAGPTAAPLNTDRPTVMLEARSCNRALGACRAARQALAEFNPNESLLLERLFLHLPAVPR
ncbi:MAG: hypothetical protein ABW073_10800 [Acidimicrobiia bacterium]